MHEELVKKAESILDIGSADNPVCNDADTLDRVADFGPDYVHDLSDLPLPVPSNEYDLVVMKDVQEHLSTEAEYLDQLFQELQRILTENGRVYIRVPHYSGPEAAGDVQHTRTGYSSEFNVDYVDAYFSIEDVRIRFAKRKLLPWNYLIEPLANINPWIWEHRPIGRFPAKNIEVVLK